MFGWGSSEPGAGADAPGTAVDESKRRGETLERLRKDMAERQQNSVATRRQKKINWIMLSPLLFAPALPLIRIGLRKHPKVSGDEFAPLNKCRC